MELIYTLVDCARHLFVIFCFKPFLRLIGSILLLTSKYSIYESLPCPPDVLEVDFIVVGSGSAGSVVASRLAEIKGWNVLLLEAGAPPTTFSEVPGLNQFLLATDSEWGYKTIPQKHAMFGYEDQRSPFFRGKTIGGSSAINYMMYVRGNKKDYDNWEKLGNPGWNYSTVLKYFKKSEDYHGEFNKENFHYHSTGGPMSVEPKKWGTHYTQTFLDAGIEMGFPIIDPNAAHQRGFSTPDFTIRKSSRESAGDAFILPKINEENLRVVPYAHVTKIILDANNRATGVQYSYKGKNKIAMARKEVIVSAGAVDSPKLLMLSGIGPKEELQKHGIVVHNDLPGVGQNFHDHPVIFGITYTAEYGTNTMLQHVIYPLKWIFHYKYSGSGPYSVPFGVEGNAWARLNPGDQEWPDVQVLLMSMTHGDDLGFQLADALGFREDFFWKYYWPIFGIPTVGFGPTILRPKSRGSITLTSRDPFDQAQIDPNYLSHPDDVQLLVKAIKFAIKIGDTDAFRKMGAKFHSMPLPGCEHLPLDSDEYWNCYAQHLATTMYHPAGSCKMAPLSDPMGVLDNRLRVRNVTGLRVIDASIMPEVVSGNTNAPVIMIGERGADFIKEDWGKQIQDIS